ncbi:MAG: hypothetical protein CVV64_13380 [Candidatus Wallbacteria bacterium HGW-Wallbacteria-1]|jgi:CRP-like cAMP-binding protein|uniref:Cyclic nucleotide-binding domain-containing protein n=1 Tax=Candidatus Wallbacteria bacterium HGW-Wallbacteria-1 TaxID=2013854 RepID=A0A2N1PN16_9BACT|nr:MAG: hypothetical protein CVV64_13380 [Candidatus Wallbacteria bacterium HGW-Wallbacteria-1]
MNQPETSIQILRNTIGEMVIFHGLLDNELDLLISRLEIRDYKSGELICREGEPGRELFVILYGSVSVIKTDTSSRDRVLMTLGDMDSFGEMTLIDVMPRSATIKCDSPTRTASLSNASLYMIYRENLEMYSKIILNVAREFSRRLRLMDDRFVEFSLISDLADSVTGKFQSPEQLRSEKQISELQMQKQQESEQSGE